MRYYARRITFYVVTFWAAVSLNFLLPRAIPGDPKQIYLDTMLRKNGELTPGLIQSVDVLFGSDDATLWEQYLTYWKNIFTGDLGTSVLYFPAPVSQLLGEAFPWTVGLVGLATIIAFLLGVGLGAWVGWKRGTWVDHIIPASTFLQAVPY